jgi:thiol-disulfide isomerase/thioredoxin
MAITLKRLLRYRGTRLLLEIIFFIILFSVLKIYLQRDLISGTSPIIVGTLLKGELVNSQSYLGKPLLLHFWATWCKVCKLEENSVAEISKTHQVVTIAMKSGTKTEIEAYLKHRKLDFPVLVDKEGVIANRFGVQGVPTSFVLDSHGAIKYTEVGYTTSWGLRYRLWMAED